MIIKKQNLKKIITIGLISFTIATIPPIKVFAIWNQDNNGWWYSEGSEYSIGWKQIDGEWYYFNNNGSMAKNTCINGYTLDSNGIWINNTPNNLVDSEKDKKIAEDYVESLGYIITKNLGEVGSFILDENKVSSAEWENKWEVQKVKPNEYLGKQINIYNFKVKNHPLEKQYNSEVYVYIMISEGKVIGGYSIPDKGYTGGVYSIDGKL
ncbi:DUF4830 domain-containing protein [Clostridium beijerinckii]|jgi:hypothetical protein|uniref:DUF4830 domain-containing protein n=1 Tax=Clostridium beijerinckii TaxID=1520 RepID=A0AAW3WBD3_CLOBE|nr:DUF4830 domain-containing protein [Clostridium beijerinckii]MBC2458556.1 DUF4830 domain-containing protein [Clostridium beijerinckii]MBC2476026.1 DUF4830 domain-containing protein [Clostridium beijerinckii]MCI1581562.1 DUF4830 domain-containing protein [Clostridium beijerinckii]MCI1585959.1 DUF4830 domain-containing protein [Clostridium beijerinckii]MCI1625107.1 DUF4830 domain-containing protein [Clostridium beijerinckii]